MIKKLFTTLFLFILVLSAYAQNSADGFFFKDKTYLYESKDKALAETHYLGNDIGFKFYVLKSEYTWQQEGTVTSPGTKTYVEKPTIYNSVRKLSKYYKKDIKKGLMDEAAAREKLSKAIDAAISMRHQDTTEIESQLKSSKNKESIEAVFNKVTLE